MNAQLAEPLTLGPSQDRRREAESGLRAASAEAERLLNALTRRGDALTAAVDTFQAEQARRRAVDPCHFAQLCSRLWF